MAASDLVSIIEHLKVRTRRLRFEEPVAYVYYPLEYAWPVAKAYLERFGQGPKEVLFLGMNPGPFGMGQTGVPFGEVAAARDFLDLKGEITAPKKTHPKRPVQGWSCPRSEVSGARLWGAIAKKHQTADRFFARSFILNYCPLLFLGETGANVTLPQLTASDRKRLEAVCDASLKEVVALLKPKHLIGVGGYAAKRLEVVTGREVITMPHPSPASPKANQGWHAHAKKALKGLDLL